MKLIEDLGMQHRSGPKAVRYGLFQCPNCGAMVEKIMSNGKKAKSCGACEKPRLYEKGKRHLTYLCEVCGKTYEQQKRLYEKAKWKDRCPEHRYDMNKPPPATLRGKPTGTCPDCGKPIWRGSTKCKSCAQKGPTNHCIDCGIEIHRQAKRCKPCYDRLQNRGLSKDRVKFQNSRAWNEVRQACFERDDFTCQNCGTRGGQLNAHHLKPYRDAPELRLDLANLTTLCERCHYDLHAQETGEERWNAKLTEALVEQILERIVEGRTQAKIAEEFEISQAVISHIRTGRSWKNVYARFEHRLPPPPERAHAHNSKLSLADANRIRELFQGPHTRRQLAKKFGVSRSTISRILRGESHNSN